MTLKISDGQGYRNCTANITNTDGGLVEVNFDNIGIPSVIGMTLICARYDPFSIMFI